MTYVSLYRKWRPPSFSALVGQDHVARTLANSIRADRVAHAYLFAGPRGTGKTSTAKILAKGVNCQEGPTPEPCGRCPSCLEISAGTSLDVIEMDAASNRGIDEIRELRDKVAFAATTGRHKVYIIDEVHMLTEPAFNALLKTLEEPPAHVIFILATTDPNKVPATIASRCQHFEFRRIPMPVLTDHLAKIAKSEEIAISRDALDVIARQAEGSLRDAIGMLDQLTAYTEKSIDKEETIRFLGLIDSVLVEECIDLLAAKDAEAVFEFVEALADAGRDWRQFAGAALAYLRDLFILNHVKAPERRRQLVNVGEEALAGFAAKAELLGDEKVRSWLVEFGRLYERLRSAAEPRLTFELALIGLTRGEELTVEALSRRLGCLEDGAPATLQTSAKAVSAAPPSAKEGLEGAPVKTGKKKSASGGRLGIAHVKEAWPEVLAAARKKKLSLGAYLVEGQPSSLAAGVLEIAFGSGAVFSREELSKEPHRGLLKEVLLAVLGTELDFSLTSIKDAGVSGAEPEIVSDEGIRAAVEQNSDVIEDTDVLDLIRKSFGAEVVDER